jgi:hypothetical protein
MALTTVQTTMLGTGAVLQVVSTTKTDTFSTTSGSLVDITGLSVSITPTNASNKILVFANVSIIATGGATRFVYTLVRNSTAISIGDAAGSRARVTAGNESNDVARGNLGTLSAITLDSPNTTSATTYKIQTYAIDGSTIVVNRNMADSDSSSYYRATSSITVMEVSG